jgi:hypothetical protein
MRNCVREILSSSGSRILPGAELQEFALNKYEINRLESGLQRWFQLPE